MRISFLIANWNSGDLLDNCTRSLLAQTHRNFEVIIVDNGSTDGSEQVRALSDDRFRVIKLGTNVGFSEANNIAYSESNGEVVVLLNNDVVLDSQWTAAVLRSIGSSPDIGAVACQLRQTLNPSLLDSAGFSLYTCGSVFSWFGQRPECVDHVKYKLFGPVAAAAAYRRIAIQEAGLFAAEYFAYYEDTDLAFRMNLLGYRCCYEPSALGFHRGSATGRRASSFQRYHLRRNIEYLYFSNMQGSLVWRHLGAHIFYELTALVGMSAQGQSEAWFKAKFAAWRMRHWMRQRRTELSSKLSHKADSRQAFERTASLLVPTSRLYLDRFRPSI